MEPVNAMGIGALSPFLVRNGIVIVEYNLFSFGSLLVRTAAFRPTFPVGVASKCLIRVDPGGAQGPPGHRIRLMNPTWNLPPNLLRSILLPQNQRPPSLTILLGSFRCGRSRELPKSRLSRAMSELEPVENWNDNQGKVLETRSMA